MIANSDVTHKRILVLTADAGFGHRRAAEAIAEALRELYGDQVETVVENPLHAAEAPDIIRQLEEGYDDMVVDDSTLYRLAYTASDAPLVSDLIGALTARLLNEAVYKSVERHQPHAVVSTHPAYAQSVAAAIEQTGRDAALAVVITDLTDVHSLWYSTAATMHFVATSHIREQAIANRIPATRVRVTGLPVHPAFSREKRGASELREELGWKQERLTGLFVASARTRQVAAMVRMVDRAGLGFQLCVVTGGVEEMYDRLVSEKWQGTVHVYGRVDNMAQMMKASDFIVTKAGGLIVSESLACGLPMVISAALPGQETGNARFVTNGGAGVWAPGPVEVAATIFGWRKNRTQLDELRANARKLGKPEAAYQIAQVLWGLA